MSMLLLGILSASLVAQMVQNLPAVQEIRVQSLGWDDPLEKGMATHSTILAWRNPWTEEPGGLPPMESQRVRHDWMTNTFYFPFTFLHSLLWRSCVCVLSHVWLFVTPWTVTHQAPLSMELPRQEYWNGLSFPPPGDLPDTGVKYTSPASPTLAGRSLPLSHLGSHYGEIIFPIWKLSVVSYGFHVEAYTPWYAHKGLHNLFLLY